MCGDDLLDVLKYEDEARKAAAVQHSHDSTAPPQLTADSTEGDFH